MPKQSKDNIGVSETPTIADEKAEVSSWLRTIDSTLRWRDGISSKMGWARFIDEYKGDWAFLQSTVSIPIIPVNTVYAYTKTEIARLYFKDPWITINPKRVDDIGAAQIAEQVINYTWGELDLKRQMKLALLEALLVGHSWMKVGYVAEFGTVESQPKEKEKRAPGRPKKEAEIETSEFIKSENVFAYYVPYKDILFDPSATYPPAHNARWMAHRIVKPLRAVKESGLYKHTDDLRTSKAIDEKAATFDTQDQTEQTFGKDIVSVTLYEIYDLDHMTVTTVSPGCEYKLREIPYPDYLVGGFPFVQLAFNPIPGEVYPLSDIAPHEPLIMEHLKIKAIEMNHLKRWNRQIIVEPDLFTPEEEAKFKDAVDGAIIHASAGPIAGKFEIPPYAPVQSDVYGIYNQNLQEWQMVAGQTPPDQGAQAKTQTRTLGELRLQLQGGRARSDEKVDVLEDFIEETARKLLTIMQKKYDLPKIARIVGEKSAQDKIQGALQNRPSAQPALPGGQPNPLATGAMTTDFSFSWNRTDMQGEMDVDVVAGSTVPLDKEAILDIMMKLMPFLPAIGAGPGSEGAKAFAKELLRQIGIPQLQTILDIAKETPPQPDPEAMKIQADMQAKQADVQNKQQIVQAKVQGQMAEQKIKLQGMQMEQELKRKAMEEKLAMDHQKRQVDIQHQIIKSVLEQARQAAKPQNPHQNGGSAHE